MKNLFSLFYPINTALTALLRHVLKQQTLNTAWTFGHVKSSLYKKLITSLTLLLVMSTPLVGRALDSAPPVVLNQIVAFVNDDVITTDELTQAIEAFKQLLHERSQAPIPPDEVLQKQALQRLIYDKLQLQLANASQLTVTAKEIKAMRDKLQKAGQTEGVSDALIKKRLLIGKVQRNQVATKVHLTQEEIAHYQHTLIKQQYLNNRYHLEDILVPLAEHANHAEKTKARTLSFKIAQALKSGNTLAETIVSLSLNTESLRNQDLGWRSGHALPTLFINALDNAHKGAIVGPLKADNGYHILKLVDKESHDSAITMTQAQDLLFQKRFVVQLKKFLKRLKEQAYIKINPVNDASA